MGRTLNLCDCLLTMGRDLHALGRLVDASPVFQRLTGFRDLPATIAEEAHARLATIGIEQGEYAGSPPPSHQRSLLSPESRPLLLPTGDGAAYRRRCRSGPGGPLLQAGCSTRSRSAALVARIRFPAAADRQNAEGRHRIAESGVAVAGRPAARPNWSRGCASRTASPRLGRCSRRLASAIRATAIPETLERLPIQQAHDAQHGRRRCRAGDPAVRSSGSAERRADPGHDRAARSGFEGGFRILKKRARRSKRKHAQ